MYLENVFLHGGLAPVLPSILPVSALKVFMATSFVEVCAVER